MTLACTLSTARFAAVCVGLMMLPPVLAGPPTFELLPSVNTTGSGDRVVARGVSGDGRVVVGSTVPLAWESPFMWRKTDGAWVLIPLPGEGALGWGRPISVSRDGDSIAGMTNRYYATRVASGTPAIWTGVLSGMPAVDSPLDESTPDEVRRGIFGGISNNGAFAAGFAQLRTPTTADGELWGCTDGAATRLSPFPSALGFASALVAGNAVSGDGSIVVGSVEEAFIRRAFRWTAADGFVTLATPTSGWYTHSRAECISRDGTVIGGHIFHDLLSYGSNAQPCVWRQDVREDLALPPGRYSGRVFGLSGDGSIAVGVNYNLELGLDSGSFYDARAVFWLRDRPRLLSSYLTSRGVDLQGITPHWLSGVSDDGFTLVGFGSEGGDGSTMTSFVVTLPTLCAGDLNEDGLTDFADYAIFLDLYTLQDPRADLTGDGQVDFIDYLDFLNLYELGC